jgi:hypothetical protein
MTEEIAQPLNRAAEGLVPPPINDASGAQPVRSTCLTALASDPQRHS